MKMSQAIKKGLKLNGPQCFERLFDFDKNDNVIGCCALGSACLAFFKKSELLDVPSNRFYEELKKNINCKIYIKYKNLEYRNLINFVIELNDSHKKTREQIVKILQRRGL